MKCVDCKRKLPAVLDKCMYCGGVLEAVDNADTPINCAACHTTMEKNTILGITIDECPGCNARWFDRSELAELIEKKREAGIENPTAGKRPDQEFARFQLKQTKVEYRDCLRCGEPMMRRNYEQISGVMIDTCPEHGIFLDGGEFDRLRAFVDTEGPKYAQEAREKESAWRKNQMEQIERLKTMREQTSSTHGPYHFGYYEYGALEVLGDIVESVFELDW